MSYYPYAHDINLHVTGRISAVDAARQTATAVEILKRLENQPGVILADEVGMGKTFVSLAVAVSVALADRERRPVVVMVPPSLKDKWPRDFELFREKCVPESVAGRLQSARAENAVAFLKLLDDPPSRRKAVLFVTHGAMSRGLQDGWVKLALIQQALYRRHHTGPIRSALCRIMGDLLDMKWVHERCPDIWKRLLATCPSDWLYQLRRRGIDPEGDDNPDTDDDPVPQAVIDALRDLDTSHLYNTLCNVVPRRTSNSISRRVREARQQINNEVRDLWHQCIRKLQLRLPLLVLDEAHHLKNAKTRLASLFQVREAQADADELASGPLGGVFERMLFLTATPFQLGHNELCSILGRFGSIAWDGPTAPPGGRAAFEKQIEELRKRLDAAQEAVVLLDTTWGLLRREDLCVGDEVFDNVESWWSRLCQTGCGTRAGEHVLQCYRRAHEKLRQAEHALRPWVIRHLKPKTMPGPHGAVCRRRRLAGRLIRDDSCEWIQQAEPPGLAIDDRALLPFLLAARATACTPESRPVFAEGLASSYEAFWQTRRCFESGADAYESRPTDEDDDPATTKNVEPAASWYLQQLGRRLPVDGDNSTPHPKVDATVHRAVKIWSRNEKVLIFCHYIATGKALRRRISEALRREILCLGAQKLGQEISLVEAELAQIGRRFFDSESPVRRACDAEVREILHKYPTLEPYQDRLVETVRRSLRTPSFLVRYFPLGQQLDRDAVRQALDCRDSSGVSLRELLQQFFEFLVSYCGREDRERYIDALERVQTGSHRGTDVHASFSEDELQGESFERLMPNVRLVNGDTKSETRQRLMLTFNTPFYPEILIASSVMAEGVDLHLNCRHIIHHDLCWNPSTLEQRTGRIDRIGAKVELCGQPIHVYIPYIAETQDEKMYRVVMDRERWFSVVMGENFRVDARSTDRLAERIPLPASVASELAFRLEVVPG
ncbi:MAG: hypothetical protein KatS3mg109_1126 [Pirellulaceae bacterium]|nr:MAG: hypothetical protein KatS3mg109_1126 [Pirellulaceae bacterium]